MNRFFAVLGHINWGLARFTMVLLGLLVVIVVTDIAVRALGFRPLAWASSAAEYILLYAAFLPMPALVRGKGHVFVAFLHGPMSPALRRHCESAVYAVCLAICIYLAWIATAGTLTTWRDASYETKNFDMPMWLVYLPMALGFSLSAFEWLRFLSGTDSLYGGDPLQKEGF